MIKRERKRRIGNAAGGKWRKNHPKCISSLAI